MPAAGPGGCWGFAILPEQDAARPEAQAIAMARALLIFQDNQTLLDMLEPGYSAKLRHCGHLHRINISSMHEQLQQPNISAPSCCAEGCGRCQRIACPASAADEDAAYRETPRQMADGLSQVISPAAWPFTLLIAVPWRRSLSLSRFKTGRGGCW